MKGESVFLIYHQDRCTWFEGDFQPNEVERKLLTAVSDALPEEEPPKVFKVNDQEEYVLLWVETWLTDREGGSLRAMEYSLNVQGLSELPLH